MNIVQCRKGANFYSTFLMHLDINAVAYFKVVYGRLLDDVSFSVTLNSCPDPDICCGVLSALQRWMVSTIELLVYQVTSLLNCSDSVHKFPNVWVIHPKFGLQSSTACFNIVVGTMLSIQCPILDRPRLRGKQCTTSSPATILTSYVAGINPIDDWRQVLRYFICQ